MNREALKAAHEAAMTQWRLDGGDVDGPSENVIEAAIAAYFASEDPRHLINLREDGWTIQHPLSCRPKLFDCAFTKTTLAFPPEKLGVFPCGLMDGELVIDFDHQQPVTL